MIYLNDGQEVLDNAQFITPPAQIIDSRLFGLDFFPIIRLGY
jgi:hypothetical protein